MAWKSAPDGEMPILPFHCGCARSMIDAGNCAGVSFDVLYASTVERAAQPTQLPSAGEYCAGTWSRVAWSIGASSPLLATKPMPGEFSVRNTSAGEADPSCTSWLDCSESSPLRIVTLIPVCAVIASASAWVRSSCWALYTVMLWSPPAPLLELPHAEAAAPTTTTTRVAATVIFRSPCLLSLMLRTLRQWLGLPPLSMAEGFRAPHRGSPSTLRPMRTARCGSSRRRQQLGGVTGGVGQAHSGAGRPNGQQSTYSVHAAGGLDDPQHAAGGDRVRCQRDTVRPRPLGATLRRGGRP